MPPTQMAGAARKMGMSRVPRALKLTSETVKMEMPRQKKPNGVGLANLRWVVAKGASSREGLSRRGPEHAVRARGQAIRISQLRKASRRGITEEGMALTAFAVVVVVCA
jgi:hypothetical protein